MQDDEPSTPSNSEQLDVDSIRCICDELDHNDILALSAASHSFRQAIVVLIESAKISDIADLSSCRPWHAFKNIRKLAFSFEQSATSLLLGPALTSFLEANRKDAALLVELIVELADPKGYGRRVPRKCLQQLLPCSRLAALVEATSSINSLSVLSPTLHPPESLSSEHNRLQATLSCLKDLKSITVCNYSLPWAVLKGCTAVSHLHLEELDNTAPNIADLDLPSKQHLTSLHLALHAFMRSAQKPIYSLQPLASVTSLQHLTLQGTAITITPETLAQLHTLSNLHTLKLLCAMEDVGPAHFCAALSHLRALRNLNLPYVEAEASLWRALCSLDHLHSLACGTIQLGTDDVAAGGEQLVHSTSLQRLDVFELRLAGSLRLRSLAPALQVLHMRMCSHTGHCQALQGHQQLQVRCSSGVGAAGGQQIGA
jgi:hypothetical protein